MYELAEGEPKIANQGLPTELEQKLLVEGIGERRRMGRVDVLMHSPAKLAVFYDRWCAAEANLVVLLHTQVTAARLEGKRVVELSLYCRGTAQIVKPRAVVDASGDAALAALTAQPFEMATTMEMQRAAYVVALGGVGSLEGDTPLQIAGCIAQAVKAGELTVAALGAHLRVSVDGSVFMTIDLPDDCDSTRAVDLTRIEFLGRETAFAVVRELRGRHAAFAKAEIVSLPARAGIRESRRWTGEAVLTEEDLLAGRESDLDVAKATWPMELRETARGPKLIYPREGWPCGIPLGVLRAKHLRNVFVAGRCISTTHRAQASTRVMGTALATGQAAGIAAAIGSDDTTQLAREVRARLA
ncbi:MAG: FAD-dependent oxidoreductase [Verrucomicrobiaceae bacterium]|nr:FAD-dependent oxidoreductase [Verrucomicrobiaceae bacterium]